MEHVSGWCFRGIYKGGLWEDDLHVSAPELIEGLHKLVCIHNTCILHYTNIGRWRETLFSFIL